MLVAEAKVETERSSRYLVQLCRHVDAVARAQPQMQAHVEWSDDRGVISFDWGRCMLRAVPGVLTLWLSRITALGVGARPWRTRSWTRRVAWTCSPRPCCRQLRK